MALRCLSFRHYEHLFTQHEDGTADPFPDLRVLLFDPRLERGGQTVGERWRTLDAAQRAVDLVVIRGSHEDLADRVERDTVLRDTAGRTPVLVLAGSWQADEPAPRLTAPGWAAAAPVAPDLDLLRHHELLALILASKALSRERDCHYLLPSSRFHAEAFIRLADALDDHTDLVRLADWVLPLLRDGSALLGDNGSLLGLLSTVRYEARRRFGWTRLPIATLNEYPADSAALRSFIDTFAAAEDWERVLFLITVSSSGTIATRAEALTDVDMDVVVLCGTDLPGRGPESCFTRCVIARWDAGVEQRCERCPDLHVLEVDPQTYEVRPRLYRNKQRFDMDEAGRCAKFWEAVDRQDAVSLHQAVPTADGNPAGTRHLAVALRVERLLADDWFRGRCLDALRGQPRPDLVLIPRHDVGEALRDLVCEAHELDHASVEMISIGDFDDVLIERLRTCAAVLVADDVLITAETLVALRGRVHRAGQRQPDRDVDVWGFVAVARPPSQLELNHVKRPFTAGERPRARLAWGFDLYLPGPGEERCPWCAERTLLEDRLFALEGTPAAVALERIETLRAPGGLPARRSPTDPPAALLLAGDDDVTRTIGSYFGGLRSPAAFAAVSAVTQKMKDAFLRDRKAKEINVLDVALALEAFGPLDPILLAGLLRTFDRRDLRNTAHDGETARALGEYELAPGMLSECGLAAVAQKLPPEAVARRLEQCEPTPVTALLRAILDV